MGLCHVKYAKRNLGFAFFFRKLLEGLDCDLESEPPPRSSLKSTRFRREPSLAMLWGEWVPVWGVQPRIWIAISNQKRTPAQSKLKISQFRCRTGALKSDILRK
jgi:hypothetical protein